MNERDIFIGALQRDDPAARPAYLGDACGADAALRGRVEELLAAYDRAGSFLETPSADPDRTADLPAEAAGAVIGPYKLVEPIGEGGMGIVFLAQQQEPVKRLVALKVVKAGMDSRQVLARFEAERQALALMDHPHIARVLDAGATPSGRPYFVMELVKGTPITRYCDDHTLTPKDRLGLFVQVCQAVQHAHQKGVIHRDLKPSNVLVAPYDGRPVVKVIDFGVAKAAGQPLTDRTLVTGLGAVVGTPEYMSPEQAELNNADIDTRSDIYALGVLLYELLTGTTPLTKQRVRQAALLEVLRVIREEEPPRPSTRLSTTQELPSIAAVRGLEPARLSKLVRGELDWIVMKALEKDRGRRYETANGFAADVERYLADEPVQACPPSAGYRLRKFARRNKASLVVAGLVLFFLVVLGSGVGWAIRDRAARDAAAEKDRLDREAEIARERDGRRQRQATRVEEILGDAERLEQQQKWPEALAAVKRADDALAGGDAADALQNRARDLRRGLEFVARLEQIHMQRLAALDGTVSNARADRDYALAFREYGVDVDELGVETSIGRLKARPALAAPAGVALDRWVYARSGRAGKAPGDWRRLVAVARGIDPEPLRDRLRSSWVQPASVAAEELGRLADSIDIRAQQPAALVDLASRLQHPDAVLRLLRDAHHLYPGDFELNYSLAAKLAREKDYEGAVRFYTAAVALRPHSTFARNDLGAALAARQKLDEAIACYRKAIEIEPTNAAAHNNIGLALVWQGKPDEAIAWCRKAIRIAPKYAAPHNTLGMALIKQGKAAGAVASYRRAIELDAQFADAHNNLGNALSSQGEFEDAIASYRKAVAANPNHVGAHRGMGSVLTKRHQFDAAVDWYRKAAKLDPTDPHTRDHLRSALPRMAWHLVSDPDPARRDLKRAREAVTEAVEHAPLSSFPLQCLGWTQYRLGDWRGSIEALEKSCKLQPGGTGDAGQWIVLALAHARLAARADLPERAREQHQAEARRWYERADEHIDSAWKWRGRPAHATGQAIWDFRAEARELMGIKEGKK